MNIHCGRCNGMMVRDMYTGTQWADLDAAPFYRCVMCGNCEDDLIIHHRKHPATARPGGIPFRKKVPITGGGL